MKNMLPFLGTGHASGLCCQGHRKYIPVGSAAASLPLRPWQHKPEA